MTDWPSIVIPTASGLVGAAVGGLAALKAANKAGKDAQSLARTERLADEQDRRNQLARDAARDIRTIVTESLTHLYNIGRAEQELKGGKSSQAGADRTIAAAKGACDSVRQELLRQGYLLPDEVRSRLEALYLLMSRATYGKLSDDKLGIDVQNYGSYLRLSLQAVVRGETVPERCEPPDLDRPDRQVWVPDPIPAGWGGRA